MPPTVVCPLTSTPSAERAIPSAIDAASLLGGSLELFSAVEDAHMVERRRAYLEELCANQLTSGQRTFVNDPPTVRVVVDPHAPLAISRRSISPDVTTVMATSTQPLMHTGYIGSAAERTTREACNPTLLIGPHNTTRLSAVSRVVAPCDGSRLSEQILPVARLWADHLGIELWVVTSLSPRQTSLPDFDATTETVYVRRLAKQVDADWEVLHDPDPAKSVVRWAEDALIAVTTHGRSGLSRLVVGSVTTAITRWATGPVLVASSKNLTPVA